MVAETAKLIGFHIPPDSKTSEPLISSEILDNYRKLTIDFLRRQKEMVFEDSKLMDGKRKQLKTLLVTYSQDGESESFALNLARKEVFHVVSQQGLVTEFSGNLERAFEVMNEEGKKAGLTESECEGSLGVFDISCASAIEMTIPQEEKLVNIFKTRAELQAGGIVFDSLPHPA